MNEKSPNKKNIIVLVSVSCALVILLIAGTLIYNSNADKGNTDKGGFVVVNPARDESDVNEDYQNNENPSEPTMDSAETDEPVETVESAEHDEPENTTQSTPPENIDYAPDFTVYDYDGNAVKLSDSYGKPIVFNFWATWCGPCKSEMPGFEKMYKKYKDKVVFMMINSSDSRKDVLKFMDENGYTFPIYYDDTQIAAYTYGVSAIPATYVTDKHGQIYGYQIGVLPEETLEKAIKTVLGEE